MMKNSEEFAATAELVKRANEGDDDAMSRLVAAISPAATAKGIKYSSGNYRLSEEDLAQEGMIGFLGAVKSYDPSLGVPFEAYAVKCIERRIISFVNSCSSDGNKALSGAVNIIDDDIPYDPEDPVNSITIREQKIEISLFIDTCLTSFEKSVVSLRLKGCRYSEIAARLSCSEKAVDNAIQRIRKKYRKFSKESD